jgi:hypothetical protein
MNSDLQVTIPLNANEEQRAQLRALQAAFAQVCNALAPAVQQSRIWNRVTLHHLHYHQLRARFPAIGSQMVCNAIYSVSRTARQVYQHPESPFHLAKLGQRPLPLLRFSDTCPVYFDRHTLSIKPAELSLYTLDGRMHFQLQISAQVEAAFRERRLKEIVLKRQGDGGFVLSFTLHPAQGAARVAGESADSGNVIPDYIDLKEPS